MLSFLLSLLPAFLLQAVSLTPGSSGYPDSPATPTVSLDDGTFLGSTDGLTSKFLGIPYARSPTGDLRFRHPVATDAYTGTHNASSFGPACPQQNIPVPSSFPPGLDQQVVLDLLSTFYNPSVPQSEDCLTVNVWTPSDAHSESKLPILVWIHGGGFQDGSSAFSDGRIIVERSIQIGEPLILVSFNYRLSGKFIHPCLHPIRLMMHSIALGFLTGQEAQDAGVANLGYRDQRLALQWIQKYVRSFGGDTSKVVIWGQSAGAVSVNAQLLTNNGDPSGLFHGAFMVSGSIAPLGDMQGSQRYYDDLVANTGCQGAHPSTLDCLRNVSFETLKAAMDSSRSFMSYHSLGLSWAPRTDGSFLRESPVDLVSKGIVADIPIVLGTCDDEGTLFALTSLNISSAHDALSYLSAYLFHNASLSSLESELLNTYYPEDPMHGSPFGTGTQNALTPQFKRLAAVIGDWVFEAPKRSMVKAVSGRQNVWTYLSKRHKSTNVLGAAHISDLHYDMFTPTDMTDHLIHFVTHLDPNGSPSEQRLLLPQLNDTQEQYQRPLQAEVNLMHDDVDRVVWPRYEEQSRGMLVYLDGTPSAQVVYGFEREASVGYLENLLGSVWVP